MPEVAPETSGYIKDRKDGNAALSKHGNNLYIVERKEARCFECILGRFPFGL
jgi:hypothetical protein